MQTKGRYSISWQEKVESTSLEVRNRIDTLPGFSVIAAFQQTSGRGQGDHKWHSAPGENLTFSIFVRYDDQMSITASRQQLLTMASSLAVVDFLSGFDISASIKKPNDIYVDGKKICGMLIENGLRHSMMEWSIIGMGINVNEKVFPTDLPNPTSIFLQAGKTNEIKKCLEDFLVHFSERFDSIWKCPEELKLNYDALVLEQQ